MTIDQDLFELFGKQQGEKPCLADPRGKDTISPPTYIHINFCSLKI
ncbi:MAG: hypothetical protein JWM28_3283 [Chitinophagaceae bacterium]|nr:hypothetical protein [Chitinophagaceae bacterium]